MTGDNIGAKPVPAIHAGTDQARWPRDDAVRLRRPGARGCPGAQSLSRPAACEPPPVLASAARRGDRRTAAGAATRTGGSMSDDTSRFFAGGGVEQSAPGRVNLLGEHTDYNDGYVLPVAIPQRIYVQATTSADGRFHVYSSN